MRASVLIITGIGETYLWIDESLRAMPSYVGLQAAADHARQAYLNLLEDGTVVADESGE